MRSITNFDGEWDCRDNGYLLFVKRINRIKPRRRGDGTRRAVGGQHVSSRQAGSGASESQARERERERKRVEKNKHVALPEALWPHHVRGPGGEALRLDNLPAVCRPIDADGAGSWTEGCGCVNVCLIGCQDKGGGLGLRVGGCGGGQVGA
ncbi:uncharacterized protein AMSG_03340 [Thecamonas trahens ATCC 50062]|uniref:Uncharacterized protein n=1 Tax=Thecamonas trahens ATCC 50062 TaxID=461836 RepID=A0A0L0D3N7_THETB|nr:hypothetical protein AMSG_03340 [Thecamonas trahens ATCC 50062]KNC46909.1 hypothetical protein AMSG_03340 [Thecamonas trahens ATCC 50062]|eukprot:XP_013760182.1 hypothetical protein AMSG_03340 [Thecamonas trahens ATCC 50062]